MQPAAHLSTGAFALRAALFYAALFAISGIQMPFFPVWLASAGLDSREIGIVLATPLMVRIIAVPVVTAMADRASALRESLILAALVGGAAMAAFGFVTGFAAVFIVSVVIALGYTPMVPIADAYVFKGLPERSYGLVRLWGSVSFIVATGIGGLFIDIFPVRDLIWLLVAAFAVTAVTAIRLPPRPRLHVAVADAPPAPALLRDRTFVFVILAASLTQASHGFYYAFSGLDWRGAGFDGVVIGLLWSVGVVAEIVLFALSPYLPKGAGPTVLLLIGAGGAALRWGLMAVSLPGFLLPFIQMLHGLSFGATYLGAVGFIARAAPDRLAATAQGYLSTAGGIAMAVTMSLGGALYAPGGHRGYALMAVTAIAACAFACIAHRSVLRSAFRA
ncbi:MAG: MFS transporter [Pseudorhodoplanes sp.]